MATGASGGLKIYETTMEIGENVSGMTIRHSLGCIPLMCFVVCEDMETVPSANVVVALTAAYVGVTPIYLTSSATRTNGTIEGFVKQTNTGEFQQNAHNNSSAYGVNGWDENTIYLNSGSASLRWKAGTYKVTIVYGGT